MTDPHTLLRKQAIGRLFMLAWDVLTCIEDYTVPPRRRWQGGDLTGHHRLLLTTRIWLINRSAELWLAWSIDAWKWIEE